MKLSIIIPVFNEEKTISSVLERLCTVVIPDITTEIIIVDDGSTDATASKIRNSKLKFQKLKFISHKKNQGKGAAVITGIHNAKGNYILIQDADLEYDPQDIPVLLKPIFENRAKVVYGTRLNRLPNFQKDERTSRFFLHFLGNRFLSLVTSILFGQWITDMETCYKLFPKAAISASKLRARGFDFEPEITAVLLKKGYKILEVPITTNPRGYDEGKKLNTFRDGFKALWTLLKMRFIS